MADQPQSSDEETTATDEKDVRLQPDGMNPHIVPEEAAAEEEQTTEE
jgi:hypothetical protein